MTLLLLPQHHLEASTRPRHAGPDALGFTAAASAVLGAPSTPSSAALLTHQLQGRER